MTIFMIGAGIFVICILGGIGYLVYFFYQIGLKKQKADAALDAAIAELKQLCSDVLIMFHNDDIDFATVQTKIKRVEELLDESSASLGD